jgi:rhamnose transport system permease protein
MTNLLKRWEVVLAMVLVLEFVLFSSVSPYFLSVDTLSDATFNFTERALVALPLALLIIAGEIDISVAAIIALSSVTMGLAAGQGVGTTGIATIGLGTGLLAGCVNGALVTLARVPSIVATIGTMTLFRGIAYAVLGDRVLKNYPESSLCSGGYAFGPVSSKLALFMVFAVVLACSCIARAGIARHLASARIRWRANLRAFA